MAEPKTEIDRRMDRLELAIRTLAFKVLKDEDANRISQILGGTNVVERPSVGEMADRAPEDG